MPPKHQKQIPATADIVDLDSSDDEINNPVNSRQFNGAKFHTKPPTTTQSASVTNKGDSSAANFRPLDDRSFWRAGAYEIGPTISTLIQGDLEHARVHPRFLHSNATSHKWASGGNISDIGYSRYRKWCNFGESRQNL
ncbi:PREDICTED: uncharacterized protein LOC105964999 [Erythranthe guttata]|uniref:uncharacterized protein LOC105964999 n=1 Tax=Erythranthe guttata TaxID=4155 RepID=UPI00064DBBEC|nr:PREDICTED: uncharacterized protein LOC105964999 [Erythranthe guttata]|eukprot:XP_012844958.1 PREDICTED: uncharacterized protein LOC105964999 [Erythranthe guttata]